MRQLTIHGLILQIGLKSMVADKEFEMMKIVVEGTEINGHSNSIKYVVVFYLLFFVSRFLCEQQYLPLSKFPLVAV